MTDGEYRYQPQAESHLESAVLEYGLVAGPKGMMVNPTTGHVTWRPANDQHGQFAVDISVTDKWGSGSAQSFSIGVSESPAAPPANQQ